MDYHFSEIEKKWQQRWREDKTYSASNDSKDPKYYVLDMFPYPSGAGLHVGHPLGYIASDIYARFKRHKGFNVLHPMGYDAFGLPAEQYAIQTGQHPAITTEQNIARYREQLDKIGFSFDWDRQVKTCDPEYYRWTQWIFIQLFDSWYDRSQDKARPIKDLIEYFEKNGSQGIRAACSEVMDFSAEEWNAMDEIRQSEVLLNYRLAYRSESMVNWCPELGTVLANDEVKDGVSERGGYPVVQKKMMQWSLRISAYAQRLLDGLERIDWTESLKESQRNWIGRSEGASIHFAIKDHDDQIEVFSTRPDTIFGATFMVLAPEHELVRAITTPEQKDSVEKYIDQTSRRSERDRMADTKTVTGVFTGAYAKHPFSGKDIPIWIADYVLVGYGTGAVMAVPGHDSRDHAFAQNFGLPIVEVVAGGNVQEEAFEAKEGEMVNSDFLNGMQVKEAIAETIRRMEEMGIGTGRINYRLRDAVFGRQRYWGEPIPIWYDGKGIPHPVKEEDLPVVLPEVDKYLPTEDGEPPLARAVDWNYNGFERETTTMPGWAGSSWYFLRYMDPHNEKEFVSRKAEEYWKNVDLYIGGSEHATGHLLYARFWQKFFFDRGWVSMDEPFQKLINQGMIQGMSAFAHRKKGSNTFISYHLVRDQETTPIHVDVSMVHNDQLDLEAFKAWREEFGKAEFITDNGVVHVSREVEKMSKSKFNVVTPDAVIEEHGADALRMYEMFLGPIEQSKPWNTQGLSGVTGFLRKFWRLSHREGDFIVSDEVPNEKELKALHTCIKKVNEDMENFSFNTSVSAFMICTNELTELKCNKRSIIEPLVILLSPFAPHMAEELWEKLGHSDSVTRQPYPTHEEKHLVESTKNYPVSFNGKVRFQIALPADMGKEDVEASVMADERTAKYLDGKQIRKVIVVPGRIVNIVIG